MMRKKTTTILAGLSAMFAVMAASPVAAEHGRFERLFNVAMDGAQEVPPIEADSSATTRLFFNRRLDEVDFRVRVKNGVGITQTHLHCAAAGVNGPVVAFLFGPEPDGVDVDDATLAKGTLTADDILADADGDGENDYEANPVCGIAINTVASLLAAIRQDKIYVNLHTLANGPGELRGQVFGR